MFPAVILGMIELHLVFRVPLNKTRPVIEALQVLAKNVRTENGCIGVEVCKTVGVSRSIYYYETWESEIALQRMVTSRHFSQLASLMELSVEPPECQFRFITDIRGLEFAAQIRGCQDNE
jgi:quinol monooxygenase YgiN